MAYKILCNISNITDYRLWSEKATESIKITESPKDLANSKINARLRAANILKKQYNLPDIDLVADPYDIERWVITDADVVNKIADYIGFRKPSGRVQVLPPGAMVPLHTDNLERGYLLNCEDTFQQNDFSQSDYDLFEKDSNNVQRVLILLEDWRPGQLILFNNEVFSHWKKGDVVHWEWQTVVHSTINAGYWNRPLLRLSGFITEKFNSW